VAVAVMALGIGATTSLFTIVRSVLLRPLPFHDPEKLVMVYEHFLSSTGDNPYNQVAAGDYYDWREQTHGFQDMAAWHWWGCNFAGEHAELPEVVNAAAGSWNLFPLLGIQPAVGRTFTPEEDRPESNRVVLLSWSLFQRRFGGDRSIVGKQVRLDSTPYTVIGVLPDWFTYPSPRVQLWVPYASTFGPDELAVHDMHATYVIAKLKSGVTAQSATRQVAALQNQIHKANPSRPVAEDVLSRPMIDDVVKEAKTSILVLLGAVGCMLLIACLNVSNLLVARGAARRKEVAIRGALGGSRLTLIREQMTESFLICLLGGTLGLLLSFWATQWLGRSWHGLPRSDAIHIDGMVLWFSIALVFFCALLAGLLPAISSTGKGLLALLQDSSRTVGGSASRGGLRRILLTAEIALTVVLLVSAGLLFKSFVHLRTSDLGCLTDNVLTMKYGLPEKQYAKSEMVLAFNDEVLERVRGLPGVLAAGLVSMAPGAGWGGDFVFTIPEHPSQGAMLDQDALFRSADPGYFNAIGIPLLSGRLFTSQERLDRARHVVLSRKAAEQYFPGESPLGKHITMSWVNQKPATFEIVGVVGDTLHDVGEPLKATMYFSILSGMYESASNPTIVVRTADDPLLLSVPVQKQIAALDPSLPVYKVLTMRQIIGEATAGQSFSATLVLSFAALSLLLAAIGLYGVLSYLVSQRVTEIGIRIALGAQRSEVLRLVLLDGLRPVVIGLLIGSAGAAAVGMLIKSILFGTQPVDPTVFAAMVGSLLLTSAAASALPAFRACRIEPTQALRTE
jgi:predicted permease